MFKIMIYKVTVLYADCPASGLAAVDWRRARGLAERPDNLAGTFDPDVFIDEPLCRAGKLDVDANLVLGRGVCYLSPEEFAALAALPYRPVEPRSITPEMLTTAVRCALLKLISTHVS